MTTDRLIRIIIPTDHPERGAADEMSRTSFGWVFHPADYDPARITIEDCRHDSALKVVDSGVADGIIDGTWREDFGLDD